MTFDKRVSMTTWFKSKVEINW